jgi:hypothetical protein
MHVHLRDFFTTARPPRLANCRERVGARFRTGRPPHRFHRVGFMSPRESAPSAWLWLRGGTPKVVDRVSRAG